jgi:nucleoside-diphosphate-sugar epimerase
MYHENMDVYRGEDIQVFFPVLFKFCLQAFLNKEITIIGDGSNKIGFLNMEDSSDIIIDILKSEFDYDYNSDNIYNVSGEDENIITLNQLVDKIQSNFTDFELNVTYRELSEFERSKLAKNMVGDNTKIKNKYGFVQKISLDESIPKIINRFRELGVDYLENVYHKQIG